MACMLYVFGFLPFHFAGVVIGVTQQAKQPGLLDRRSIWLAVSRRATPLHDGAGADVADVFVLAC